MRVRIRLRNECREKEVSGLGIRSPISIVTALDAPAKHGSSPNRTQKGVIPIARWLPRGGSQARTTAPDLRSGLAGVRGFKSLAHRARREVPSPAPGARRPIIIAE